VHDLKEVEFAPLTPISPVTDTTSLKHAINGIKEGNGEVSADADIDREDDDHQANGNGIPLSGHPEGMVKVSSGKGQELSSTGTSQGGDHDIHPTTAGSRLSSSVAEPGFEDVKMSTGLAKSAMKGDKDSKRPRQHLTIDTTGNHVSAQSASPGLRPRIPRRASSTSTSMRRAQSPSKSERGRLASANLEIPPRMDGSSTHRLSLSAGRSLPSPMPSSIPLPPLSIPTYLQLELSSQRPSHLYIHRSASSDFPYESSRVKMERLINFLLLPLHLESVLWFGMLACLDSWLYTFTILPLRLLKSFFILGQSWSVNLAKEVRFLSRFVYKGAGRVWKRRRSSVQSGSNRQPSASDASESKFVPEPSTTRSRGSSTKHHRRSKSIPSPLLPDDKADILKGLLIISTCLILLKLDASRMYHWIRGQSAVKLYVIYNVLEVCDRLFSAIGQDVLECLFSREALERKPDGHSKILRPFWLFVLALVYTVIHTTALFCQVITLNVAVNSYSNALITLLLSNQFVEVKSTVFKKFEKENLFQLTCADVVERFQLWHMLIIIASRNIVETGGLSKGFSALDPSSATTSAPSMANSSHSLTQAVPPITVSSILPRSFTLVPAVVNSITAYVPTANQVLGPFLVVLGSEMLVDWIKHAYINKFNNTRPTIYGRFLDVLTKDYYTNAFADQNLTKRLGLPVIPLSCLLIRASIQTYQMFIAAWVPSTPPSSSTSLASIHEQYSAAARATRPTSTAAAISKTVDDLIRAIPVAITNSKLVTHLTTVLVWLMIFLLLLACKLVLGMLLLAFSRSRYRSMKEREKNPIQHVEGGRRAGGWGVVEVDEDKRRWIYEDDPAGMRALHEREERERARLDKEREKGLGTEAFDKVRRYEMAAKRIW